MDVLQHLYPKLSSGGYAIVDDYGTVPGCKAAVDDYRSEHGINAEMALVRDSQMGCVYWKRTLRARRNSLPERTRCETQPCL